MFTIITYKNILKISRTSTIVESPVFAFANGTSRGIEKGQSFSWNERLNRSEGGALNERMGFTQSPIMGTIIKVSLLKQRGYVSMIDYYSKFKVSIYRIVLYD